MWNPNVAYSGYHGQRDYRRTSYTPGNWMNRLVKETNVDSISASTSAPRSTTGRGNSRSRKTCVTTSVVVIAFILLLLGVSCVPLILYYVEKDQYKYYKADASITFQGTYNESLGDLSTQTSIDFQQDFCQVMEQTQANKFKETYSGCLVNKIKNGSIIVAFTMYYYAKLTVQTDEVKSEITIYLKTALTTTFYSKFNITVDVNSLTVSLLQTGQNDYQSGTSDSRFQTSLLTSTTQGTTLLPTISSNADNSTSIEVTTIFTETTTTVPPETTTSDTPASTTVAPLQTTNTETPTTTTTAPPEITTTDTSTTTNTAPPETTTTVTPTTTNTAPPETTTTDTPTTTTTAETTTTDTPTTTTTAETTTTDTSTSAAPLEATTTVTSTSTTAAPPETTTTDTSTTTTAAPLEATTTDTSTTTTAAPPETTTTVTSTSTTAAPPETTTTDTSITTTAAPPGTTTTDIPTTTTSAENTTTSTPITTETISDTTISHSLTATTFNTTSSDNDTTTAATTETMSAEPFAVVAMKNSIGEIGKQAYIPCTISVTSGDWVIVYIYQTHNDSIEAKIASITNNGTKTVFNSDPLLMPTFSISGSQIEAIVTFNFSNYDYSSCSMRLYRFICSVEMTSGSIFNASAEFNLIAPLIQPTVTLHRTEYMFNEAANVSLAGINATCNATRDRSSDIVFTIAMRIQNVSGDDIDSLANVTSYNVFTETCGELVFINWSEVDLYRADMNGSSLTCYVQINDRTVTSENITLTFLEEQMPP